MLIHLENLVNIRLHDLTRHVGIKITIVAPANNMLEEKYVIQVLTVYKSTCQEIPVRNCVFFSFCFWTSLQLFCTCKSIWYYLVWLIKISIQAGTIGTELGKPIMTQICNLTFNFRKWSHVPFPLTCVQMRLVGTGFFYQPTKVNQAW